MYIKPGVEPHHSSSSPYLPGTRPHTPRSRCDAGEPTLVCFDVGEHTPMCFDVGEPTPVFPDTAVRIASTRPLCPASAIEHFLWCHFQLAWDALTHPQQPRRCGEAAPPSLHPLGLLLNCCIQLGTSLSLRQHLPLVLQHPCPLALLPWACNHCCLCS